MQTRDCIDHFISFFDEVTNQCLVSLFVVPWAFFAECSRKFMELCQFLSNRSSEMWNVERCQVVCFKGAVHVVPRCVRNLFIWKTKVMQQNHTRVGVWIIYREFDIGQHPIGMRVCHQHGPRYSGSGLCKHVTVDEAHASFDGVNCKGSPYVF